MAQRTAAERPRIPGPAFGMESPSLHPASDTPYGPARRPSLAPHAVIAVVLGLLLSFWAGRMVEQRSQLGRLLVLAPTLDQLEAATRSADSLGMRLLLRLGREPRPRVQRASMR